jgi:hypothetical protein
VKKNLAITCWLVVMVFDSYASGVNDITVEYTRYRIPVYYNIIFDLKYRNGEYQMVVKTSPLEGYEEYEYSRTEKTIPIDKEYFDMIDEKIISLDFREIITRSKYLAGADGFGVRIKIGSLSGNLDLYVWSPLNRAEERKTDKVHAILQELFIKADIEELLISD